jgi:Mn-containing catalase
VLRVGSGNLLADFRFNVTAESQGRLQVSRLYQLTEDKGVRDMLSFLLARDTMHQNQWLAAIKELEEDGLEMTPCPSNFPQELELKKVSYRYLDFSEGNESKQGGWAKGSSVDGRARSSTSPSRLRWARCRSLARSIRACRERPRSRTRRPPDPRGRSGAGGLATAPASAARHPAVRPYALSRLLARSLTPRGLPSRA